MNAYQEFPRFFRSPEDYAHLLSQGLTASKSIQGPAHDIEQLGENEFRLSIVVAGYDADSIEVETKDGHLLVNAQVAPAETTQRNFSHRGIAIRPLAGRFALGKHVRVSGATLKDGLLHIELLREVPEAAKNRIEIRRI